MYRENLEDWINELQLWKEREDLDKFRYKAYSIAKMSSTKKMSNLQCRMHFNESMESNADSDLEDGEMRKLLLLCVPKELLCDQMQWTFWKVRFLHKRLNHQTIIVFPENRLHCFHQNVMHRDTKRGVLCSEMLICRI